MLSEYLLHSAPYVLHPIVAPAGVRDLRSPMARKEPGAPCTNWVACRGSGWTASESLMICRAQSTGFGSHRSASEGRVRVQVVGSVVSTGATWPVAASENGI